MQLGSHRKLGMCIFKFAWIIEFQQSNQTAYHCYTQKFCFKGKTFEDILDVISWSMVWLAHGLFPNKRHDGSSFGEAENTDRKQLANHLGWLVFWLK